MTEETGFWWSVGRASYKYFEGLDWMYDHVNPNKVCIAIGFVCFAWWLKWQADYNKKAKLSGGLK